MFNTPKNKARHSLARRTIAAFLSLVLVFGLIPSTVAIPAQAAAAWAQEYLDKLVSWGVMRGDQEGALHPENNITRAELVTMINRAYGYDRMGEIPFEDVSPDAWYYDDVAIAYNVGYFTGTSETTASPNAEVTREQAVVLLARNMMLDPVPGEALGFTDSRDFSSWSRDLIAPAVEVGMITGDPSGAFRPKDSITRAEIASMLSKSIGTPVQSEGENVLGNVFGNVTISDSNVTLKDTVIAGDLYLTGGIGLGNILLENVTVLGRIVASGAGESQAGESSIILRNVTADEMVVDSISNQLVSLRAEGDTVIDLTSVRTPAYLEDRTQSDFGFQKIELNGESGIELNLAGNIKNVVNLTPDSKLVMAQGTAQTITIDEHATNSNLQIENGAVVEELNLDTATSVTGEGDIDTLNVASNGSTVEMLPDEINIRPGVTANIAGEEMDNVAGEESSADPRILAGYPEVRDAAPNTAVAAFSTNKAGTVYWAVSAVTDGSISEEEVIAPPSYGKRIIQSGTINAEAANTEYTAQLSDLASDGSYYLTAVMVDNRGQHSPVKVTAFSTPDDTVPEFAKNYPVMTKITNISAQVTVMTNKNCRLYYALLPKDSTEPKEQDFKANAVTGNLGYGALDAVKNSTLPFTVNNIDLEELATYDLYLWLTDYDGAQSSKIEKLTFTTVDGTPPVVTHIEQSDAKPTTLEMTFAMNEPGTLYWVVVKEGDKNFPRPLAGQSKAPELTDEAAKIQVENGMGAIAKGSSRVSKADTDVKFTVSGLEAQTAYDLYYVAKDTAGNYSASVIKITVNTQDNTPPTVTQEFTALNITSDEEEEPAPLAETDVRLVFSESVAGLTTVQGEQIHDRFMELYQAVISAAGGSQEQTDAKERLGEVLRRHIELYQRPVLGQPAKVADRASVEEGEPWAIDFREAKVTMEDSNMVVTFENGSGINLSSGATYYFVLTNITDTSSAYNLLRKTQLPDFTTVFAQVFLEVADTYEINAGNIASGGTENIRIDMGFTVTPQSTESVDANMMWDLLLWTDTSMAYTLYSRDIGGTEWVREGDETINVAGASDGFAYTSLTRRFRTSTSEPVFGALRELRTAKEYGIHVNRIGDSDDYTSWNHELTMKVTVAASSQFALNNLSRGSYITDWNNSVRTSNTASIGQPDPFTITKNFTDSVAPNFEDNYPVFTVGDIAADMEVMLDRPGTVYYVAVPVSPLDPEGTADENITDYTCAVLPSVIDRNTVANKDGKPLPSAVPTSGATGFLELASPGVTTVTSGRFTGDVRFGVSEAMEAKTASKIHLENLNPDTLYYVYLVTKGVSAIYSDYTMCYRFHTKEAERPILTLDLQNPTVNVTVDRSSYVSYLLVSASAGVLDLDNPFFSIAKANTPDTYMGADYSILDALINDYNNNGSVFDNFATDAAKSQMETRIRNSNPDASSITMKQIDQSITGTQGVDCSEGLLGSGYYIFVAMARSQLGSGNSFRAIRPVQQMDTEAPKVVTCITEVNYGTTDLQKDYDKALKEEYNGGVTITFDEDLYYRHQSSNRQNIAAIEHTTTSSFGGAYNPLTSPYTPLGGLYTPPTVSEVKLARESPQTATNTMQFTFSNMYYGAVITFGDGLCDRGGTTRGVLQLKLDLAYNEEQELWEPVFTVTPEDWQVK